MTAETMLSLHSLAAEYPEVGELLIAHERLAILAGKLSLLEVPTEAEVAAALARERQQ